MLSVSQIHTKVQDLDGLSASVQLDDPIQSGSIGLIDAVTRSRPSRGLPFRQYARLRINGAIFDSLRDLDWASRYFRCHGPVALSGRR